jgi:flagellar biosynthesis anti-sigma factor FlgM
MKAAETFLPALRCEAELKFFNVPSILELQGKFKAREQNMRIDLNHESQALPETSRSSAPGAAAASASASQVLGGEDQAELSGAHAQVQALVAQAAQLPEVREERVQALRQAVERGGYAASPEAVASALVTHMLAGQPAA